MTLEILRREGLFPSIKAFLALRLTSKEPDRLGFYPAN
jgi:hypothetical protein